MVVHQQGTVTSSTTSGSDSGCGCGGGGGGIIPLLMKGGGGIGVAGGGSILCGFQAALCNANCQNKGFLKQGCLDSCAAAERLCNSTSGSPVIGVGLF